MSCKERRERRQYQKYASMSEDELRILLRNHAMGTLNNKIRAEELPDIIQIYEEKRSKKPGEKTPEQAWESFQTHYQERDESLEKLAYKERPTWVRASFRAATTVAAVFVLFFSVMLTAAAFGLDLFGISVIWNQEQLTVQSDDPGNDFNVPIGSDSIPYIDLEMMLVNKGIMANLTPQWIPDGYTFDRVEDLSLSTMQVYCAYHVRGEDTICLSIESAGSNAPPVFEKDSNTVQLYTSGGTDFYIFSNKNLLVASGIKDSFLIVLDGPVTVEEMKQMLDSIVPG